MSPTDRKSGYPFFFFFFFFKKFKKKKKKTKKKQSHRNDPKYKLWLIVVVNDLQYGNENED